MAFSTLEHTTQSAGLLSTIDHIRRIVESVLGVSVPDVDANIIGLGANSMELVRIINLIEDDLGWRLKFEDVSFEPSIAALAKNVETTREHLTCGAPPSSVDSYLSPPAQEATPRNSPVGKGIREDDGWPTVELANDPAPAEVVYASTREFALEALPLTSVGQLLDSLRQPEQGTPGSAQYASAGALYPVQAYLYVKAGGVEGLQRGLYYYHPRANALWLLAPDLVLDETLYEPLFNAPIYRRAAFAIYLVSRPAAIEASYPGRAHDYCLLEAGAMAQLLRMRAASCGIGLCAIGDFAFEPVRNWFELDDGQTCLHSLVGGCAP
jgi:SagB-type dehydrogenase family enzyme